MESGALEAWQTCWEGNTVQRMVRACTRQWCAPGQERQFGDISEVELVEVSLVECRAEKEVEGHCKVPRFDDWLGSGAVR